MGVLRRLAAHAATVIVGGDDVHLRFPTDEGRLEVQDALKNIGGGRHQEKDGADDADLTDEQREERARQSARDWNAMCALALHHTVLEDDDPLNIDECSRLVVASMNEPESEQAKELTNLIDAALRLCGLNMDRFAELGDGVRDHAQEASDSIGEIPT